MSPAIPPDLHFRNSDRIMVDVDDDGSWTVVVNRRAFKLQSSSSGISTRRGHVSLCSGDSTHNRSRREPKATFLQAGHEAEQQHNEALILLKMKRSMARVEESEFFKRFLDQAQSPRVFDNLCRAASDTESHVDLEQRDGKSSDEGKTSSTLSAGRSSHGSFHHNHARIRICDGEYNMVESKNASVTAARVRACEGIESGLECRSATLTEPRVKICGARKSSEAELECRSAMVTAARVRDFGSTDSESEKELAISNSNEGDKDSSPNQGLGYKFGDKQWHLQIVVYGLGNIADSEVSRCQLALILLLKQRFSWVGDIQVYDPVLSQSECKVIEGMGCSSIAINEEGRRSIDRPTIFYMPHCEEWLYDNVLQANWMPQKLGRLVILGNSFRSYHERWSSFPGGRSKPPPTYVLEFQQVAQEIPLEAASSLELPVFNNMSWHFYQQPEKPGT